MSHSSPPDQRPLSLHRVSALLQRKRQVLATPWRHLGRTMLTFAPAAIIPLLLERPTSSEFRLLLPAVSLFVWIALSVYRWSEERSEARQSELALLKELEWQREGMRSGLPKPLLAMLASVWLAQVVRRWVFDGAFPWLALLVPPLGYVIYRQLYESSWREFNALVDPPTEMPQAVRPSEDSGPR